MSAAKSSRAGFEYQDLLDGDAIRILELQRATDPSSPIQCEVITYQRALCGAYEALSYWWGPEDQKFECITVNGGECNIGYELAAALRQLRLEDQVRRIWADALCINQRCKQEKNKQVQKMDVSYGNAAKVLVWLGEDCGQSQLALDAIEAIGSLYRGQTLEAVHGQDLALPMVQDSGPEIYIPAIRELLQRQWFQRVWVIQEVCLAPPDSVRIYCGSQWIHFWQLTNVQLALLKPEHFNLSAEEQHVMNENRAKYLESFQEPPLAVTRQLFAVTVEERPEIEAIRNRECTLLRHLWVFRGRNCSNPRDRIYALRSMSLDLKSVIMPDYGAGIGAVYANATRKIIELHKKLDVLGMCLTPEGTNPGVSGRPSWAPDFHWGTAQRPFTPLTMIMSGYEPYYSATSSSKTELFTTNNDNELGLRGYIVGKVQDLASEGARTLQEMIIRSRVLAERVSPSQLDFEYDSTEAFWRTLITNRTSLSKPARPEVEGQQFQAWWETLTIQASHSLVRFADFNKAILNHWVRRLFFTTSCGHIGLGPVETKVGDHVGLLAGSQVPFILRSVGGKFQVVGEAYVHELMDGKYWTKLEEQGKPHEGIVLV